MKQVTVNELFKIQDVLDELYTQNLELGVGVALKLSRLKKSVDESCQYVIERLYTTIPGLKTEGYQISETESIIYNGILSSVIDIDNQGLTEDELSECKKVHLKIQSAEYLELLF